MACAGRSASAPTTYPGRGDVTEGVPRPRCQLFGSVAGARDAVRGFEKTSLRSAPSEAAHRQRRFPGGEADGGCNLRRSVAGRLGQTGRLGLARPGSANRGARRKGRIPSPSLVPPRLVGPAGCKQRPPSVVAGGALARGGLRVPFGQCGAAIQPTDGSLQRGLSPRLSVRVGCALSGSLRSVPGSRLPVHTFGIGKVGHWLWRKFHRRGAGKEPRTSWAGRGPPGSQRGRRSSAVAQRGGLSPRYGMVGIGLDFCWFSPLSGERGEKPRGAWGPGSARRSLCPTTGPPFGLPFSLPAWLFHTTGMEGV